MAIDQNKLNDLFGDNWGKELEGDLDFGEDGEVAFKQTEDSDDSEDSNDLNEDESDETDAENSDDDSEASDGEDDSDSGDSDEVDPVESRFQSLESSVDKLIGLIENLAKQKPAKQEEQEPDEEDDDDTPLTRKELRKMMEQTVEKATKPYTQQTKEQQEAAVVTNLVNTYGDDFKNAVPAMKKLLATNPALGIQGAWDLVSEIKGIKKPVTKATRQDSGSQKKVLPIKESKKGDAAKLRDKAANLSTAKGVSSGTQKGEKKRAVGIDNIIKQSWDELFEE